jgi:hypothetical protein
MKRKISVSIAKMSKAVMSRKGLLNQSLFTVVILWSTILLFSRANVLAQQTEPTEEEQEVDLDSLDEELGEQSDDKSDNTEKLLPMNTALVEIKRNPALILIALAVLMPLSTLLLPLERMRKGRRSQSRRNIKTNS